MPALFRVVVDATVMLESVGRDIGSPSSECLDYTKSGSRWQIREV